MTQKFHRLLMSPKSDDSEKLGNATSTMIIYEEYCEMVLLQLELEANAKFP